MIYIVHLSLII